ncbi:MAG: undecaprenyl-phosphate glucose phosphotransferase [Hyphomicrobiales bacterium]|nr:undecaprenyl-phosphate glucose phosphotransferase [Hyphomicrobiales bacterium]
MPGSGGVSSAHPSTALRGQALGLDAPHYTTAGFENLSVLLFWIAVGEFVTVAVTAYGTALTYRYVVLQAWPPGWTYISAALYIAWLILVVSLAARHYVTLQTQPLHRFLWNGIGAVGLAFSFFLSTLFLLKVTEEYSRATFFIQLFAVTLAVLGLRTMGHGRIQAALASGRIEARRAVLVGGAARQAKLTKRLREAGVRIVGSLPFPSYAREESGADEPQFDRAEARRMIELCRAQKVDDVVILATAADLRASAKLADTLSELPVGLHMIPADAEDLLSSAKLGELGALVTIQLLHPPLTFFHRFLKRLFDIVAAGIGLIALSPILALVALAIKLDSRGPVFFRQTRHGYNNETIRVFKFRSMTTTEDGDTFRQARRHDPRITRLGQVLRRTNVDELPQLLNVLTGEMSIVGPRPHPVALNQMFEEHILPFSRRHNVKPGITGWAQVNGHRGQTDTLEKMQRRFECDLYYIENWSFLLDMKIILMTLFSKSAYNNAF